MPGKGRITSIETRIKQRNSQNRRQGHDESYIEEALDMMLAGFPIGELSAYYGVKSGTLRIGMSKAALYRLLKAHGRDIGEFNKAVDEANGHKG